MKIPAVSLRCHGADLHQGNAVNAANPARQVTLIGKTGPGCNFGEASAALTRELSGALQAKVYDVPVRRHANRSRKDACKMERASPRYFR